VKVLHSNVLPSRTLLLPGFQIKHLIYSFSTNDIREPIQAVKSLPSYQTFPPGAIFFKLEQGENWSSPPSSINGWWQWTAGPQ